jgi:predicted dehydrogenase
VKIDTVLIAVLTLYHYLVAKSFLQNGVHYLELAEKPFTLSVDEAEELIETAKTRNLGLQIRKSRDLIPWLLQLRRL